MPLFREPETAPDLLYTATQDVVQFVAQAILGLELNNAEMRVVADNLPGTLQHLFHFLQRLAQSCIGLGLFVQHRGELRDLGLGISGCQRSFGGFLLCRCQEEVSQEAGEHTDQGNAAKHGDHTQDTTQAGGGVLVP